MTLGPKAIFALAGLIVVAAITFGQSSPEGEDAQGRPTGDWGYTAASMAQRRIRDEARDPSRIEFREVRYVSSAPTETTVCGEVNGANAFGGMTGFQPFILAVSYGGKQPNGDTRYVTHTIMSGPQRRDAATWRAMEDRCKREGRKR